MLTERQVLNALSRVQEPELHRDLVTLNMIKDIRIQNDAVNFTIVLTTPACPLRGQIESEAKAAVAALGAKQVNIKWDASVPSDKRISGKLNIPVKSTIAVASGKGVLFARPVRSPERRIRDAWAGFNPRTARRSKTL